MPYVETTLDTFAEQDKSLLAELIHEIRSPREKGQPFIEVRNMSRGGLRHVYVIWDRWDECRPEVRAAIIRDAFAAVKGPEYEKSIAVTVAATVPEAVEAGLLPYEVTPFGWNRGAKAQAEEVRQIMLEEGASPLRDRVLPILAFGSQDQGEETIRRLQTRAPQYNWGLVITRPSPG